ncbi:dsDNA nuclease domain-containing protein [Roseococcus sp. DSY-14]|uniref:dsDNA nuclease domain-containing protein n=1 Tax=Roseococcus sp. DSY-14 TaxID=3369650 RepID=UPI00387A8C44
MTALASAILAAQPREKAGARTGARFAFQVHASLAKLLELHEEGADYRALFDHFDDLTILVGSSEPTDLRFYQIKGREPGPWKTAHFCSASGDAPRTTIGKMYHHTISFSEQVDATIFLTNAPFEFALAAGGNSTPDHMVLVFPDLAPTAHAAFAKALEPDFASPRTPHEGDIIRFERTRVPLVGYDTFVKGRLVEMFDDLPGSAIAPLYRTLVAEITAKSNDTTVCATIEDLYTRKGLCRGDVEHVLSEAQTHRNILGHWESVDAEMKAAGRSLPVRLKARIAVTNYLRDRSKRMPETFALHGALKGAAASAACTMSGAKTLCDAAAHLEGLVDPNLKAAYDDATWEAALLVEAFDTVNGQ